MRPYLLLALIVALLHSGVFSCGGSGSSSSSDPANVTCAASQRTFTLTNSTSEQIWVGITGGSLPCLTDADCPTGATGSCAGADASILKAGHCSCTSDTQCGSQAACNTSNNICFMYLPNLTTAQVSLAAGAHSTICMPAPVTGRPFQWSGNIFARTGCDSQGQNCKTGDCNASSSGLCPTGTGGNPPMALAEFTLSNQTHFTSDPDFYDVSIINGINVGISMSPVAGTFVATAGNPYSCQSPGSTTASGQLSACSWTLTPTVPTASPTNQTTLLRDVYPTTFSGAGSCPNGGSPNSLGICTCSADSDCSSVSGLLCGLATNAASGIQYAKVCGTPIGWWTADQICLSSNGTSPDIAALNCSATNNDLYACAGANAQSCYNNTATPGGACCGCATSSSSPYQSDWPLVLNPGFGGSDDGCYGYNTNWFSVAQPWIIFLKEACPTAYTYPYDDATSTFTCQGSAKGGAPNYNITFLPTH